MKRKIINIRIISAALIIALNCNCSKKVYTKEQLLKIAKTDSIKKEQMKMLETENIDEQREIQDALYFDRD